MSRRISSPTFVGRAQELGRLDELLGLAGAGTPGSVLVAGEAGVGKTRLVKEFTTRAASAGARVLAGGCIAFAEGELAYGPLVEALRSLVHRPDPAAVPVLRGVSGELARLVPELADPDRPAQEAAEPAPADPAGAGGRLRLFEQLLGLLEQLGRSSPVVLVLEDLQWADRSTMEFLAFLIRNLDDQRLVLIGTYRSDELGPTHWLHGWIAEQRRSGRMDELQLQPFSRGELAAQLGGILGAPVDTELVDRIYARCEGNAFFAEELAAAAAKGTAELSSGLREVLLARLQGLSGAARAALGVAAVAGRRVDHRLLAAADVMAEAELTAALRETVDGQVLVTHADEQTYRFRHALLQEAVYGELLPGERTQLHAVFAPALTELLEGGSVDRPTATAEIARHWDLAHDTPKALAWSVRAGAEAERVHAFAEALGHYQRALTLWDRVSDAQPRAGMDRVELARRAAHAAHAVGDYQLAASLIEVALAQVDPAAEPIGAGLLHERRGWYLTALGDDEAAFAAYRQAVRLVPATPPSVERARVLATYGRALMIALREDEAFAVCEEALAMARQQGAEREAGVALTVLGTIQAERGNPDMGIPASREGLRIAERLVDPDSLGPAYLNLGYALWLAGRIEEGHEVTLAGYETMRRLGRERQHGAFMLANAGSGLILLGRWDEADELLRRALELSPPEGWGRARVHCELAELAIVRGRLDAAEEQLNRARPSAAQGALQVAVEYWYALADLRAWQGRLEEARAAVTEALDLLAAVNETQVEGRAIWLGLRIEGDRAERGRARRDPAEVADACRAAKALLARGSPGGRGLWPVHEAAAWAATRDAEFSRAQGHPDPGLWESAAIAWRDLRQPYRAAYAAWRRTEALLAGNQDQSRVAAVLRTTHDRAVRLGAELLCRELEALAGRARISLQQPQQAPTPATTPLIQRLGLTPRELQVLGYLVAGRSNREIGEALFISAKTASVHVSNILRKLDVTNRVEAAGVAHKLGLTQKSPR